MKDNLNIFEQALEKLAFRQPVPVEVHRFALYNKRKILEATLKRYGDYSFFYGLTLRIYFSTKRLGINLSVLQSKIILAITGAIIAGVALYSAILLSSGILYRNAALLNNLPISSSNYKENQFQEEPAINFPAIKQGKTNKQISDVKYRIGIERFSGDVDEAILNNITDNIAERLIRLKGKDKIIDLRKSGKDRNINMLLSGSVEKLGKIYIMTAKVISIENAKVLFVCSEEIKDIDNMEDTISNIADKTANGFE